ncbi:MAG: P1 family peptidase [Acidobacteriota bacterium]
MLSKKYLISPLIFICLLISAFNLKAEKRIRIREMGVKVGILKPGKWNSITDVNGVKVGHFTLIEGKNVRTGVTAILPHSGNIFQEKVPGAIYIGNGFGKLTGISQVEELGNIETPIILTSTLSIPAAWEGILDFVLSLKGNENVRSVNPVIGETNDGFLNDIRGRHIKREHVLKAIENAKEGPVEEGCVGAGTGTICFGFKGGIGTSSRVLPPSQGGYTVGVLVQTNFGGVLQINGAPVGVELEKYYLKDQIDYELVKENHSSDTTIDGSCMIVVATDAPLDSRNLKRLAKRTMLGLGKTGGISSNGSGDYVISFSTAKDLRIPFDSKSPLRTQQLLENDFISALFLACIEAIEEAIYDSLFIAESMKGKDGNFIEALPLEKVKEILIKYNQIKK